MSRPAYKYLIFNEDRLPLYRDDLTKFILTGDANYLKPNGEEARLSFSPDGWPNTKVKYGRNLLYWGLTRDMITPMKFPGDGRDIIDYLLWLKGYDAVAYLGILKLDRFLLPYTYNNWHITELNLTKYKANKVSVEVEALEGGMSKILKAYEDTEFEIPIDTDPDVKYGLLDGMNLLGQQSWDLIGEPYQSEAPIPPFNISGNIRRFIVPLTRNQGEGSGVNIIYNDQTYQEILPSSAEITQLRATSNCFAQCDPASPADVNFDLDSLIEFLVTNRGANGIIHVDLRVVNVARDETIQLWNANDNGVGQVVSMPYVNTIVLHPGDKVFLLMHRQGIEVLGAPFIFHFLDTGHFKVNFKSKFKPTYYKGLYPWTLFQRIVAKMLEGQNVWSSDGIYLESDWLLNKRDIILTSQDALRQIPGAVIKASLKSLFRSMNHWCASLGVEGEKLFMELYGYVFKVVPTPFLDLGVVTDATLDCAEDLLFNTVKAGGPVVEYSDINGRFEFTQQQIWKTPITKVTKELDLSTPFRRDPFGIEFARINFEGKTTTDDKGDNDVFMVNVQNNTEDSGNGFLFQRLFRPVYTILEGVPDPETIFNVELSAKRSVLNNMPIINGAMDQQIAGKLVTLASTTKNRELNTVGYSTVDEDAPIQIGSGLPALWRPWYIGFKTKVSKNVLPILNLHQYERIRVIVKGRQFFVYLFDGEIKPELNETQTWKTLSVSENDLSKYNR